MPVRIATKPRPVSSIELGSEKGIRYLSARQAAADMVTRKIVLLSGEQEIRMRAGSECIKPDEGERPPSLSEAHISILDAIFSDFFMLSFVRLSIC